MASEVNAGGRIAVRPDVDGRFSVEERVLREPYVTEDARVEATHPIAGVGERSAGEDELLGGVARVALVVERRAGHHGDRAAVRAPVGIAFRVGVLVRALRRVGRAGRDDHAAGERLALADEREAALALLHHLHVAGEGKGHLDFGVRRRRDVQLARSPGGAVGDRAVAERASDGERMSVEVDHGAGLDPQHPARRPVLVLRERDGPLDEGLVRQVAAEGEHGSGRCRLLLFNQRAGNLVVHVPHGVRTGSHAHGNEIGDDLPAPRELRGVDAVPVAFRGVCAVGGAMPKDVNRVRRAGTGPLRRSREVEVVCGLAGQGHGGVVDASHPERPFVEVVVARVVHRADCHVGASARVAGILAEVVAARRTTEVPSGAAGRVCAEANGVGLRLLW